ncbi:uncharacterized protein G2W53_027978 [Senna tora]|uniref:Uncharacterized protein n=1 Tax=Senna tora TaxID=362788 RepID=A0A834WEA4_9FABA|nr:uncharacterized protein G2W53_027978 [Senna tora]
MGNEISVYGLPSPLALRHFDFSAAAAGIFVVHSGPLHCGFG